MSGPDTEDPRPSHIPIRHYRVVLALHTNDPVGGLCRICQQSRCDEWRWAYGRLVGRGGHERWRDLVSGEPS